MADDSQEVADIIDALGDSPTPLEVYAATREYDGRYVAAAAATLGGGAAAAPVTARGQYVLAATNIAAGQTGSFEWTADADPTPLLDLTSPAAPAIVTSGVYALTVSIIGSNIGAGKGVGVSLSFPDESPMFSVGLTCYSPPARTLVPSPRAFLGATYYWATGTTLSLSTTENETSGTLDLGSECCVLQRIS